MYIENMLKRGRILLIENSCSTRLIISDVLYNNGYELETAVTEEEALQKISDGFVPDLVLVDIALAGEMDGGIDVVRGIIESYDIPVIFLIDNASKEILENIEDVRGYGFVKGSDKYALLSTVKMALKLHEANTRARMFEWLFENLPNELYIFHPKSLKFATVNRAARKNLGYAMEELNTMNFLDLNPEFDVESFQKLINSLISGEQNQVMFETMHRRKDGSMYPVQVNLQIFDCGGEKLCMALVVDLSERRTMKEELREKEATLSAIMDSVRDAIVMLDERGNVTFWNHSAEQLFGYTKEEMLGKELHSLLLLNESRYKIYDQVFKHFQLTGKCAAVGKTKELKAKNKDGQELDIEISLSALKIRNAWHSVGVVRDISERKQREEELEYSHKQYLELAENAPIGILRCDKEGNIVYVNQKTLEILGSPSIEETKKINLLTFPLLIKHGLSRKLEECLQNNKPGTYEMNYESKWGKKVWLRAHIKPLVDRGAVTGAQIIIDDITERKQLEEANKQKEERFRLMLEGIPSPAWLVSKERRILAQNKAAASIFSTKTGDYCWKGVHGGDYLPYKYKKALKKTGRPLPGTKCYFCRGDEALERNEPINSEVELAGNIWDTWWIPLGDDVYLHYATDVTRYKKIEEELRHLSITDVLTTAYNRRYFMHVLEQEIERTKRIRQPFSIIMLDLDHFKEINDRFGHAAGDMVLKSLVEMIKQRIRKTDCLARWGGEEFVILLPYTPADKAANLAEELRLKLSHMDIRGVGNVTASFGVAGYCAGDTSDTLIMRADKMLYEAKSCGRNCVRYTNKCL